MKKLITIILFIFISNLSFSQIKKAGNFYELNEIGSTHYVKFNYIKKWENSINFRTGLRKNLDKDYTENNYIELNYESDCLKIGINLAKTFYENEDFKADNNLTLFVMLKPFGQPVAPDLSNLID